MNRISLIGRLTGDPEIKYANNGNTIASFSIAVDRKFKRDGSPEADFFRCVCFGKQAEFVEKYLAKGTKMFISGEMQNNNYEKNGQTVYGFQIVVNELEFCESKRSQSQAGGGSDFQTVSPDVEEELPFK